MFLCSCGAYCLVNLVCVCIDLSVWVCACAVYCLVFLCFCCRDHLPPGIINLFHCNFRTMQWLMGFPNRSNKNICLHWPAIQCGNVNRTVPLSQYRIATTLRANTSHLKSEATINQISVKWFPLGPAWPWMILCIYQSGCVVEFLCFLYFQELILKRWLSSICVCVDANPAPVVWCLALAPAWDSICKPILRLRDRSDGQQEMQTPSAPPPIAPPDRLLILFCNHLSDTGFCYTFYSI